MGLRGIEVGRLAKSMWCCVALVIGIDVSSGLAWARAPPAVHDQSIVSLYRERSDWRVITTIWLVAEVSEPVGVTFTVGSPAHGDLLCKQVTLRSQRCSYEPKTFYLGPDQFVYTAHTGSSSNRSVSRTATVKIDVRKEGLRWEVATGAATAFSSDGQTGALPNVLGSTAPDIKFTLNWQLAHPRQKRAPESEPEVSPRGTRDSSGKNRPADPVTAGGMTFDSGGAGFSRSANVVFRVGVVADPAATTVKDLGPESGQVATNAVPVAGPVARARRQVSSEAELNLNGVLKFDGSGSFAEFGLLAKGGADVKIDGANSLFSNEGRVFSIVADEAATFRFETAFRLSIKQAREGDASTMVLASDGKGSEYAYRPAAVDDLLYLEVGFVRDNRLSGLPVNGDGRSENRWLLRFAAMPEISIAGGRQRLALGIEISRALKGGPKIVRLTYGVNMSLGGLF